MLGLMFAAMMPVLEPAFSSAQVEKGAPRLEWTKNADGSETTVLTAQTAGVDLDGVCLTRTVEMSNGVSVITYRLSGGGRLFELPTGMTATGSRRRKESSICRYRARSGATTQSPAHGTSRSSSRGLRPTTRVGAAALPFCSTTIRSRLCMARMTCRRAACSLTVVFFSQGDALLS